MIQLVVLILYTLRISAVADPNIDWALCGLPASNTNSAQCTTLRKKWTGTGVCVKYNFDSSPDPVVWLGPGCVVGKTKYQDGGCKLYNMCTTVHCAENCALMSFCTWQAGFCLPTNPTSSPSSPTLTSLQPTTTTETPFTYQPTFEYEGTRSPTSLAPVSTTPTLEPTSMKPTSLSPSVKPSTNEPSFKPSNEPSFKPSNEPSFKPISTSSEPSFKPSSFAPTDKPTPTPTTKPFSVSPTVLVPTHLSTSLAPTLVDAEIFPTMQTKAPSQNANSTSATTVSTSVSICDSTCAAIASTFTVVLCLFVLFLLVAFGIVFPKRQIEEPSRFFSTKQEVVEEPSRFYSAKSVLTSFKLSKQDQLLRIQEMQTQMTKLEEDKLKLEEENKRIEQELALLNNIRM